MPYERACPPSTQTTDFIRARLVRAERRAPLEDSGGIGGYTDLLATPANPQAEGYEEAGVGRGDADPWREDTFDPEAWASTRSAGRCSVGSTLPATSSAGVRA